VVFPTRFGNFTALDSVDLTVRAGEIHGLVGESGAGKSTVGAAVIGLLQSPGYIATGEIRFKNQNLVGLSETIRQHGELSHSQAREQAIELLKETGINDVEKRIDEYPHQFSGGMRQRVVIALALCTNPDLIIADEPTTALDVSVQKQVLELIRSLCTERNIGIILITHDIGVINEITDRVTVLRGGQVIESGTTNEVLGNPQDEYTRALMAAVPRLDKRQDRFKNIINEEAQSTEDTKWQVSGASAAYASDWLLSDKKSSHRSPTTDSNHPDELQSPILSVTDLAVTFYSGQPRWFRKQDGFKALSDISLHVQQGEVLGVVGESGSGKSTLAKAITGLVKPSAGSMQFKGNELPPGPRRNRDHPSRRQIQMVFQDPYSSLNNRQTVEEIIAEPIRFYQLSSDKQEIKKLVASVLDLVEMPQRAMLKYPHQFSGGQRQRIAVARALVARPEFLICDEPTSALDVSIQAQILNLLKDLQQAFGLSILFISHNLAVIRQMADRVVVLKNGRLIETAETNAFFTTPVAPYSQMLLNETPSLIF